MPHAVQADKDNQSLIKVFQAYCQFGSRRTSNNTNSDGSNTLFKTTDHLMDGSKWAKLCKDAKISSIHPKLDATTIDILFQKVKGKAERKISFLEFKSAILMLADCISVNDSCDGDAKDNGEAQKMIIKCIQNASSPQLSKECTRPDSSPLIDRLMESPSSYISNPSSRRSSIDGKWKDALRKSSLPPSPCTKLNSL